MPGHPSLAYIGLGGNLGEPRMAMATALSQLDLQADVSVNAVSSLYRTPPWGNPDQPDFLNAVAELETTLSAQALLERCLAIELELKRIRAERWGPRLIDLDVLWFDDQTIATAGLQVPHPRMLERAFVLLPLAEIAPRLVLDGETTSKRAARMGADGIARIEGQGWWRKATGEASAGKPTIG